MSKVSIQTMDTYGRVRRHTMTFDDPDAPFEPVKKKAPVLSRSSLVGAAAGRARSGGRDGPHRPFKLDRALLSTVAKLSAVRIGPRSKILAAASFALALLTCSASGPNLQSRSFAMPAFVPPVSDASLTRRPVAPTFRFGLPIWQSDLDEAGCGPARIVSDLGPRRITINNVTRNQTHYGLDIGRPAMCNGSPASPEDFAGTPIRAMDQGVVISYGSGGARMGAITGGSGYGHNVVVISRPDGDRTCAWREADQGAMAIRYGHMMRPEFDETTNDVVCRWVERGDIVGYVGSTGVSQGVHLDVRAGNVTLVPRGTAWAPERISYINLAAPGMIDLSAYQVSSTITLNVADQTIETAWSPSARRRAQAPERIDEPVITADDDDDDIDGVRDDDDDTLDREDDDLNPVTPLPPESYNVATLTFDPTTLGVRQTPALEGAPLVLFRPDERDTPPQSVAFVP